MESRTSTSNKSGATSVATTKGNVELPRWVNEPLLNVHEILSGHEISRLTRRPHWLLLGLAAIGQFPKRRTHCGKPVGWHRSDVLDWLTQHMAIEPDRQAAERTCRQSRPRQACLPLEISSARDSRGAMRCRRSVNGEHR
jgi:predicted DNA-binding transcriptional regulator AlpA